MPLFIVVKFQPFYSFFGLVVFSFRLTFFFATTFFAFIVREKLPNLFPILFYLPSPDPMMIILFLSTLFVVNFSTNPQLSETKLA
jgi:hypothetical protein